MTVPTRNGAARRGFTIVELLIGLMILTLIACLAITAYFGQPRVTLRNACELLVQDLVSAKNRASIRRTSVTFTFHEDGHGYEARDANGRLLASPAGRGDFVRDYDFDGVFEGVRVVDVDFGDDRAVVFDRRGQATEDGAVTLEFEGERRTIEVSSTSGVRVADDAAP